MPKKKRSPGQRPSKEEQSALLSEIGEPDDSVKDKQTPGYDLADFLGALNKVTDSQKKR